MKIKDGVLDDIKIGELYRITETPGGMLKSYHGFRIGTHVYVNSYRGINEGCLFYLCFDEGNESYEIYEHELIKV